MLRSLVRLTTGIELGVMATAAFIGAGFAALISVGMEGNTGMLVEGLVIIAAVGVVVHTGANIWRRHQRLAHGLCGHPDCHGNVTGKEGLPEHLAICDNCRRVWPKIFRDAPAATSTG